jgi:catechol 2,3-dioxygenase-like lactoylglutathione lyase family enzyme
MIRAIDHVGLTVADLDRAVEFWCGRLGLRLVSRVTETDPDIASLIGEDSVEMEIADLDAGDGRIIELIRYIRPAGRPIRARSSDTGRSHIALRVDDLNAALERIQGSQALQISRHPVILHEPGGAWDGVACCYIADPDGNIVELVQRPGGAAS